MAGSGIGVTVGAVAKMGATIDGGDVGRTIANYAFEDGVCRAFDAQSCTNFWLTSGSRDLRMIAAGDCCHSRRTIWSLAGSREAVDALVVRTVGVTGSSL